MPIFESAYTHKIPLLDSTEYNTQQSRHCRLNLHMHRMKPDQTAQCASQTETQTS
uniref:Uncharacterized protein n=1 Tax=Arion vulgaris TaxID=1028688 RepID=A0A0B6XX98_9EUPU